MTLPLSTGFPDWARQASEAQVLEANDRSVTNTGPVNYPIRFLGSGVGLMVYFLPTNTPARLFATFYADVQGNTVMDAYVIDCQTNDVARQPIPVLGPYVGFRINRVGAGNISYTLLIWRIPDLGTFSGSGVEAAMFSQDSQTVPGSGNVTLDCPNVQEGPAVWTSLVAGGNWKTQIQAVDITGAVTVLDAMDNSLALRNSRTIYLPPMHIRAFISNSNVAAQSYDIFMTRQHNRL